ncbi:MAG: cell wall hydrolase [Pseudomonadota bacterium]
MRDAAVAACLLASLSACAPSGAPADPPPGPAPAAAAQEAPAEAAPAAGPAADLTVADIALPLDAAAARAFDPDGRAPIDDPVTCLARTLYWEAGGEGDAAMHAVAHVVANRVRSPRFPDSFCAVIKQGGEARPCQFSWWCDGRPDEVRSTALYARARKIARRLLNDRSEPDPTGGAVLFHNTSVSPDWAARTTRTARIGSHIFYRLPR